MDNLVEIVVEKHHVIAYNAMDMDKRMITSENKRCFLWDNVKFVMIVLVVVGHFADTLVSKSEVMQSAYLFIYAFHMPVFLFISGMFFKPERIGKKILFYITAGFLLKLVTFFALFIKGETPKFSILSENGAPWYMFCMAAYIGMAYALRKVDKRPIIVIAVLVACVAGYDKEIGDWLCLSRVIVFFPFFMAGTLVNPDKAAGFKRKHAAILVPVGIIILMIWGYMCFGKREQFYILRHLFTGRNPFSKTVYNYGFVARLMCYFISVLTGIAVIAVVPSCRIPVFSIFGRRTINVYFWHWPIIMGADNIFKFAVICDTSEKKIIFMAAAVVLAFVLSFNVFSFPMKQLKEKIYIE